ncbi:MAG: Apocarotenoid-15,15'-oxygenase, partial [Spirulinaceae cyanobacterium RM2_2_10]|nr:Apocarotenoid-15,15'-oxygenase [Spirulinaceae cyanobacterium RM2_2_10]
MTALTANTTPKPDSPYNRQDWQRGYQSQRHETDYWLEADEIVGEIPAALSGTLFRNGPALFERGGQSVQ